MNNPSHKTILIVGASRGLGLGLVKQYLSLGWRIVATVRKESQELNALQGEHADRLSIERVDIANEVATHRLVTRLTSQKFDVLFLNAGIMGQRHKPFTDVTAEEAANIYLTNAFYPIRLAEKCAPMVAAGGVVAFMSSLVGSIMLNEDGQDDPYRASKTALNMLSRSYFIRNKARGFAVVAISPGWVKTAMGGPDAPLDIQTSVAGVAKVVNAQAGKVEHRFLRFDGSELPW